VRREDGVEMKALWRLRAPQLGAVDGFPNSPTIDAFDCVAKRQCGDCGRRLIERVDDPVDQPPVGEWPRAIMNKHRAGSCGASARAEPDRILPFRPTRHRR
jgi:hypothetical protein